MKFNDNRIRAVVLSAGLALTLAPSMLAKADGDTKQKPQNSRFQLDATALDGAAGKKTRLGYMPVPIAFVDVKPASIKKEPKYLGTPKYGIIHLGDGPRSTYVIAFDEPASGDWKIYIDKNRNGDLTDDGDGAWSKKNPGTGRTVYGVNNYVLRASWGSAGHESGHGDYGVGIYRIATATAAGSAFMYRQAARVGEVRLDGKTHKAMLVENDADAIYNKTVDTDPKDGKPTGKVAGRPVWMVVGMNPDGSLGSKSDVTVDVRAPFKLGTTVYEAKIGKDGFRVALIPTTKAVAVLTTPRPPAKPLLAVGSTVPDFRADGWGGSPVHPADYKGKILILDFWATWCGPCQKSMPHIERVYKAVKDKNVTVLAVCVWDGKDAYSKWVPTNQSKYSFPLAFDPAGQDTPNSIASKIFNVSGIPTTYIIGPDGKVADSIVGYQDGDTRVEAALKKLGVDISVDATK